jgi:hypothetical protein
MVEQQRPGAWGCAALAGCKVAQSKTQVKFTKATTKQEMGIEQKNQKSVLFSLSSSRRLDLDELLNILTSRSSPPVVVGVTDGIGADPHGFTVCGG